MQGLLLLTGAPVRYQSGSSIRGKTKVNHHARKRLKSLFHLGAMSAIRVKAGRPEPRNSRLLFEKGRRRQEQNVSFECRSQQTHSSHLLGGASPAKI